MQYFDYENPRFQQGYTRITGDIKEWCKNHLDAKICVLTRNNYDPVRGHMFPRYGAITWVSREYIVLDGGSFEFRVKDVLEIAYKNPE